MRSAQVEAFQHSCGGWYVARVWADGSHGAPAMCMRGVCDWETPAEAMAAAEARA